MIFTPGIRVKTTLSGREGMVVNRNPLWTPNPYHVAVRIDGREKDYMSENDYDVYLAHHLVLVAPLTPFEAEVNVYIAQELRS